MNDLNFSGNPSLPPQNMEAEEAVLGGILLDPEAISRVIDKLKPEAFYANNNKVVYEAAIALHSQGKPTDLMSMATYLTDHNKLQSIGVRQKLRELTDITISAVNVDALADMVIEKYDRRQLIKTGNELVQLGHQTEIPIDEVKNTAEQKVYSVTQSNRKSTLSKIGDIALLNYQETVDIYNGLKAAGIPYGYHDLDAITHGLQKGNLIYVAGRPASGKTSYAMNIASYVGGKLKLPVVIFGFEMTKEENTKRFLSVESHVELGKIISGRLSSEEWIRYREAVSRLQNEYNIYIDDNTGNTVNSIHSACRSLSAQTGEIGLVIVDYIQLMDEPGFKPGERQLELSQISRKFKKMAGELNCPVMVLSQLSRGVEQRTDKRPMMSDLRDSGCLTGDTLISVASSGLQTPIKDLVGKSGFTVWALNEQTMKLEESVVSNAFSTEVKSVFEIETRLGRKIKATGNHKFLTIQGWKRLDELSVKEHLCLPRVLPSAQSKKQSITYDEAALLGHLIGDGCTLPSHSIQYTTGKLELGELVATLTTNIFGDKISPRIEAQANQQCYQVYLPATESLGRKGRNPISEWLDSLEVFGLRSYEKFVPKKMFAQPQKTISCFLKHLWSTDGSIGIFGKKKPKPVCNYATSSKRLAYDIQTLLLTLGINARVSIVPQGKRKDQYHVTITGQNNLMKFIKSVGVVDKESSSKLQFINDYFQNRTGNPNVDIIPKSVWKDLVVPAMQTIGMTARQMASSLGKAYNGSAIYNSNLSRARACEISNLVKSPELSALANSDVYWDKIVSITYCGDEEVYDLTVPGLHNFVANNIVVHNSLEQDANLVMMLYRDEYYNPETIDKGIAEIIIVKHRNGPTGTVKLLFDAEYTQFKNMERQTW